MPDVSSTSASDPLTEQQRNVPLENEQSSVAQLRDMQSALVARLRTDPERLLSLLLIRADADPLLADMLLDFLHAGFESTQEPLDDDFLSEPPELPLGQLTAINDRIPQIAIRRSASYAERVIFDGFALDLSADGGRPAVIMGGSVLDWEAAMRLLFARVSIDDSDLDHHIDRFTRCVIEQIGTPLARRAISGRGESALRPIGAD